MGGREGGRVVVVVAGAERKPGVNEVFFGEGGEGDLDLA
jgi:hypothetical protein